MIVAADKALLSDSGRLANRGNSMAKEKDALEAQRKWRLVGKRTKWSRCRRPQSQHYPMQKESVICCKKKTIFFSTTSPPTKSTKQQTISIYYCFLVFSHNTECIATSVSCIVGRSVARSNLCVHKTKLCYRPTCRLAT